MQIKPSAKDHIIQLLITYEWLQALPDLDHATEVLIELTLRPQILVPIGLPFRGGERSGPRARGLFHTSSVKREKDDITNGDTPLPCPNEFLAVFASFKERDTNYTMVDLSVRARRCTSNKSESGTAGLLLELFKIFTRKQICSGTRYCE